MILIVVDGVLSAELTLDFLTKLESQFPAVETLILAIAVGKSMKYGSILKNLKQIKKQLLEQSALEKPLFIKETYFQKIIH